MLTLPGAQANGIKPSELRSSQQANFEPNCAIWNSFWSGGISNPLEVMEQITYLLFLRRLDELHTLEENKSQRLGKPMERRIYPEGKDDKKRDYNDLRWSRFKNFARQKCTRWWAITCSPFCALELLGMIQPTPTT
jgi:hypothetical protein